jgi:NAD(P)-dependent dehydrogenase (short-subunit alcohol dehydrogenase family)
MRDFSSKVAVVTGGCSGIGRACVKRFAERGARVAVLDFSETHAAEVIAEADAATHGAHFYQVDVSNHEQLRQTMSSVAEVFGGIDFLVNSAGISTTTAPLADYPVEDWNRGIGINLSGSFFAMKYAIPFMLRRGGGAIVNISSMMGQVAHAGGAAYVSSKHAVVGLTKAAALDYAAQGIRVNAVGPGVIETPMTRTAITDPSVRDALQAATPIGRLGTPDDIASVICFLCSEEASFVTGAYYLVDGGIVLQ